MAPSCWLADRCPTTVRRRETRKRRQGPERGLGRRPSSFSKIPVFVHNGAVVRKRDRSPVHTSTLEEASGKLPGVIIFVDFEEHMNRAFAKLFELAPTGSSRARTSLSSKAAWTNQAA